MTILSIAVCNNSSKIIFARQFVEMTRKQLEEYIVLFSRSVTQEKEGTSIETDKNRFLYYHSDPLYLVVITTLESNVIEDLEVLKLSNRLIIDICGAGRLVDYAIIENAFEIALALDDMISFGCFEGINMVQIKNLLQMDSAEEKEFKKIQMQREKHAKEQLHIQMRELENEKKNKGYFNNAVGSDAFDTIKCGSETVVASTTTFENKEEEEKTVKASKKVTKSKGLCLGKKKQVIPTVEVSEQGKKLFI